MFKWIKEILSYGSGKLSEEYHPEHLVINIPVTDISEPVHVLIDNINKYPGHWKIKKTDKFSEYGCTTTTIIKDLNSGEEFTVLLDHLYDGYSTTRMTLSKNLSWATEDEIKALKEALRASFDKKKKRVDNIKQIKKNNERKRLMELYK